MSSLETPALSVVVVVLSGGQDLTRCLEALNHQAGQPPMEVVVPLDDHFQDMRAPAFPDSGVRILHVPGRHSFAELRAAGVKASRAHIVAITEDQCIPPERWCANVVSVHAQPHAAVGGPVEKQQPDSALGWAVYLRELGTYMPPVQDGPSKSLTDCNVSYKRAALDAISEVWSKEFHEPQVHEALRQRGESLWLSPALLTYQRRTLALIPAAKERFEFGRLFGCLRARRASNGRRLIWAILSPVLPALLVGRVLSGVFVKKRHRSACLFALPYLLLFATLWSWGELSGYITGRPGRQRRVSSS